MLWSSKTPILRSTEFEDDDEDEDEVLPPMITKAVILAAGRGTRMRELTNEVPKPMVEVQGKPILRHILEGLVSAGIEQSSIVVGDRKEALQDYVGDGRKAGLQVEYVEQ